MQIGINQTKKGHSIILDGNLYFIIEKDHHKPGKGGAYVRVKLKNIKLGTVIDRTYRPDEKVELAYMEKKTLQYLYSNHDMYEFMDCSTYDQIALHKDQIKDAVNYLKENIEVIALTHENKVITVELPISIELKIVSTEPGVRGDTSKAGTKPAALETGLNILVPLFINEGDIVKIDTRTGEYIGRA
ncbi:MAG: elongation factor P [Candidatus Omnitrophota bacterium]